MRLRYRVALELGYLLGIEKFLEKIRFSRAQIVPQKLMVEPTNICNLNCIMCPRDKHTRKPGQMDMELFKKIIDETCELGILYLELARYGESLLHPQIFEMVRYAKEKGFKNVGFPTNGLLLDETKAKEALDSGLDYITFSLDSLNKDDYEKIRVGGKFETAMENIGRLIDLKKSGGYKKPNIAVTSVNMELTHAELKEFREYWKKRGADRTVIHSFITYGGLTPDLSVNRWDTRVYACSQIWKILVVMWDGSATVCCADINCIINVGDAKKERIIDIWNGEKLRALRRMHINHEIEKLPLCNNCDYIRR